MRPVALLRPYFLSSKDWPGWSRTVRGARAFAPPSPVTGTLEGWGCTALIIFEFRKCNGPPGPWRQLDAVAGLRALRSAVNQWAHFVNLPYAQARREKRRVLRRFASEDRLDPLVGRDRLAPRWPSEGEDRVTNQGEAAKHRLNFELVAALEMRAAKALVDRVDTVSLPERP